MKSAKCRATMAPRRSRRAVSACVGIEANEIAVIDELATGLAAGVEARVAPRALAMQRQQAEAFDRTRRRRRVVRRKPDLEDRFAKRQEFIGKFRRSRDKCCVRRRDNRVETRRDIVEAV